MLETALEAACKSLQAYSMAFAVRLVRHVLCMHVPIFILRPEAHRTYEAQGQAEGC